jgi:ankyrin repeat protein
VRSKFSALTLAFGLLYFQPMVGYSTGFAQSSADSQNRPATPFITLGNPLVDAADQGAERLVRQLISQGNFVDSRGNFGTTPLMRAAMNGHLRVVETLIAAGADVNATDVGGATALHLAARVDDPQVLSALIKAGADVNARDGEGLTPVMRASAAARPENVKYLLKKGADANATNEWGESALVYAVSSGSDEAAKTLIEKGASVDNTDMEGRSVKQIAEKSPNQKLSKIFAQAVIPEAAPVENPASMPADIADLPEIQKPLDSAKKPGDLPSDLEDKDAGDSKPWQVILPEKASEKTVEKQDKVEELPPPPPVPPVRPELPEGAVVLGDDEMPWLDEPKPESLPAPATSPSTSQATSENEQKESQSKLEEPSTPEQPGLFEKIIAMPLDISNDLFERDAPDNLPDNSPDKKPEVTQKLPENKQVENVEIPPPLLPQSPTPQPVTPPEFPVELPLPAPDNKSVEQGAKESAEEYVATAEQPISLDSGANTVNQAPQAVVEVKEAIRVPVDQQVALAGVPDEAGAGDNSGGFALEIFSFPSDDNAFAFARELQSMHSDVLSSGQKARVLTPLSGSQNSFRLSISPVYSSQQGQKICQIAAAKGLSCQIAASVQPSALLASRGFKEHRDGVSGLNPAFSGGMQSGGMQAWGMIATYTSRNLALEGWYAIKRNNYSLVQSLNPDIQVPKAMGSRQTLYRLRIGPFNSMLGAEELCRSLQAQGINCTPVKDS